MKISDVIRHKGTSVVTIAPEETVAALLRLLSDHRIGAVVVSVDGAAVAGIVSERDIVRHLTELGTDLLAKPVSSIMSTDVVACHPNDDLDEVAETMTERRFRHLPVVVDGHLEAIVSIGDVVKSRTEALKAERDHLVGYISQER